MNRRHLLAWGVRSLSGLALPLALGAGARQARAEEWPARNVRVIVPYAAGSATDLVPRVVFDEVSARLGRTFVVENRVAGGTTVGSAAVARAEPDGYTILTHSNAILTVPAIQANVPYDPVRDFSGVTTLGNVPLVLVVPPQKNITSVQQLVAAAKARPGTMNYAAVGVGTPTHLTAERFRLAAGIEAQSVPFKGSPEAMTEVLTGRVDFFFCPVAAGAPLINDGKLVALAVSGSRRAEALPHLPTTVEAGFPNSDFDFWVGVFVPKRTPRDLVARLHDEIVTAIKGPTMKEKLAALGVEPLVMSPADFDARVAREAALAIDLAKAAHLAVQ
jgi:tripartite-type tricarboxylate transporter receptor subunit TctC